MKLSIIVPIYGVEQYLHKCVDSLLAQDYDDYEIILVDDGSPDACPAICDEYASPNSLTPSLINSLPKIRVIHQKNGGLSVARNAGIAAAKGEYVCFVDSDDCWQHNVLAGLINQMERDKLDVLRFRLQYVNPEGEVYNPYKLDPFKGNDFSEEPTDGVSFLNSRMNTRCYAWQFILRRDLIYNSLTHSFINSFTPGIFFEDTDWTPRMLCSAKRVASTETVVYNYLLTRQGSITNAVNRNKQKKVLDDKMRLVKEMQRQAAELEQKGLSNAWFKKMIAATVISIMGMLSTDFYAERKGYLEKLKAMDIYPISTSSTKARLINLSPSMTVALLHWKNAKRCMMRETL